MERCSPVEMRKNLEIVGVLKNAGIDFVAIPVLNDGDIEEMIELLQRKLNELENRRVKKW